MVINFFLGRNPSEETDYLNSNVRICINRSRRFISINDGLLNLIFKIIRNYDVLQLKQNKKFKNFETKRNMKNLKNNFILQEQIIPVQRPAVVSKNISIESEWFSGFTNAEDCFFVNIFNSPKHKLKAGVQL